MVAACHAPAGLDRPDRWTIAARDLPGSRDRGRQDHYFIPNARIFKVSHFGAIRTRILVCNCFVVRRATLFWASARPVGYCSNKVPTLMGVAVALSARLFACIRLR